MDEPNIMKHFSLKKRKKKLFFEIYGHAHSTHIHAHERAFERERDGRREIRRHTNIRKSFGQNKTDTHTHRKQGNREEEKRKFNFSKNKV